MSCASGRPTASFAYRKAAAELAAASAVAETPAPHPLEQEEHDHGPGFEALLGEGYARYQRGEVSFGRLAEELGVTTWELSHLLEERGWPTSNLPSPP